jgi:hypothetical protein
MRSAQASTTVSPFNGEISLTEQRVIYNNGSVFSSHAAAGERSNDERREETQEEACNGERAMGETEGAIKQTREVENSEKS